MAIVLKAGQTYSDRYNESSSVGYYGRVNVSNFHKGEKKAVIVLEIYKNITAANEGKTPVETHKYSVASDKYDNYFDLAVLNQINVNQYKEAYLYILNEVRESSTFDENGNEVQGALIWGNWESDEA